MNWFKKEKDDGIPKLPEPPKLPELPKLDDTNMKEPLPQLPSYPQNSFGDKFSKSAIKDAVSGEEEDDEEDEADDSMHEERMMPKPPMKNMYPEFSRDGIPNFSRSMIPRRNIEVDEWNDNKPSGNEPVFVRLDKFRESSEIFEDAKRKIAEIELTLGEIKKKRDEEEKELDEWEKEMQNIKNQFEKISRNIFSKIR